MRIKGKLLPFVLVTVLMIQTIGGTLQATDIMQGLAEEKLCEAHLTHDDECGYLQADENNGVVGVECNHACEICILSEEPLVKPPQENPPQVKPPLAMLSPAQTATPKDVSGILKGTYTVIQDGKVIPSDGEVNSEKEIGVKFHFDVPVEGDSVTDYVSGGDYAEFAKPAKFKIVTNTAIELTSGGDKVGVVTFTQSHLKIIFEDIVNDPDLSNFFVEFTVSMEYDGSGLVGGGNEEIIDIYGNSFKVVVPEKKTTISGEKNGTADIATGIINWKVKVSADLEGGTVNDGDLDGFTFSDNLASVGEYVADSLKIDTDEAGGTTPPVLVGGYDTTTKLLTYPFEASTVGTRYLFFQTKIPTDKLNGNGEQTVSNTAEIKKGDAVEETFKKDVKFEVKWIEKEGTAGSEYNNGVYDPTNRKIQWSITANYRGETLNNCVITDKLPDGLTVESAKVQYWDSGSGSWGAGTSVTPEGNDYKLGNVTQMLMLTIVTTVDDQTGTQARTFNNTATIKWDENPGGTASNKKEVGIGFTPISKTVGTYDNSTHQLDWSVTVDTKKLAFDSNLRVLDMLVYGDKSLTAEQIDNLAISNNSGVNLTTVTADDIKKLTQGLNQRYVDTSFDDTSTDTTLECTAHTLSLDGKDVADLLVVTGENNAGLDSSKVSSFTYKSEITNPDIYASNEKTKMSNTASLFSANVLTANATASKEITSNMLTKNMLTRENALSLERNTDNMQAVNSAKANNSNGFRYDDKSAIFRFHINANGLTDATKDITGVDGESVGELVFTDSLPKGWQFDDIDGKNILPYEGTGNVSSGTVTATTQVSDYSSFIKDIQISPPTGEKGGTLSLTFTSLTMPYVMLLKASPTEETSKGYFSENKSNPLKNTASLGNSNFNAPPSSFFDFKVDSTVLGKSVDDSKADTDGYLKWTVDYQPYDLPIEDACLVDTLPIGVDLRTDSKGKLDFTNDNVTVNEMTLNANGSYTIATAVDLTGGEIFKYNSVTREIRFNIPNVAKAYRLSYITDITGVAGEINNNVKLHTLGGEKESTSKPYTVSELGAAAAFTRSGGLNIEIKDEATDAPLKDVEYVLLAEDRVTVIRRGVSSANGRMRMSAIPVGKYFLREATPPAGDYVTLPRTYTVEVTKDATTGKFSVSIEGHMVPSGGDVNIGYQPKGTVGGLSIEKILQGNDTDPSKDFKFTITLTDNTATPVTGTYTTIKGNVNGSMVFDASGQAVLTLKGSESIVIKSLPKDINYTVVMDDYTADKYKLVQKIGDSGAILVDAEQQAVFTSSKNRNITRPYNPAAGSTSRVDEEDEPPKLTMEIIPLEIIPLEIIPPTDKEPIKITQTPQTGDNTPIGLMATGLVVSILGIALLFILKGRYITDSITKSEEDNEKSN